MRVLRLFLILFCFALLSQEKVFAKENEQFITIVNPVRIARYTESPGENLASQYSVIEKNKLSATWLLSYDAIINKASLTVLDGFDERQEFGIFLEISPALCDKAGVEYNDTGYQHHATSIFLSGYPQDERQKLINAVFKEFKSHFGYYPKSVGSWWTDSFSLEYMSVNFSITSNLGVADQFSTDGYQVWGQYWSTPFYPSKYHAGIPAKNKDVKLDVVVMQWAARDPLNGYYSSLYSTQDYHIGDVDQSTDYFEKLINLYAQKNKNEFGQIVVGLEGDLEPGAYKKEFAKQMELVAGLVAKGEYKVITMSEFTNWYKDNFPELSPPHLVETKDLLGAGKRVFWYQSPSYRVGLVHDFDKSESYIIDLRTYHIDLVEPYYLLPNREFTLSVYVPSYFDEIVDKNTIWEIDFGNFDRVEGDNNKFKIVFEKGFLILRPEKIVFQGEINVPAVLSTSPAIEINQTENNLEIVPKDKWIVGSGGLTLKRLTPEASHLLGGKKLRLALLLVSLGVFITAIILRRSKQGTLKALSVVIIVVPVIGAVAWYNGHLTSYFISQGEVDALFRLSVMPAGKVIVYDNECLQCSYHTKNKPAVFANKRDYVRKFGKHPIVYNASVFEAKTQEEARQEFEKLNAKYIYLSKSEEYIEKIPFSPGDLNIEKVYGNANSEIWRVKEE